MGSFKQLSRYSWVMLKRSYDGQVCSVAGALEVVGERWTFLIIRDSLLGIRRFEGFMASLGVARNVLTDRLKHLVQNGILVRVPYADRPPRHEYHLTEKGRGLIPVIISLMEWGDQHLAAQSGPPRLAQHIDCGGHVDVQLACTSCDQALDVTEVATIPNPEFAGHRWRLDNTTGG